MKCALRNKLVYRLLVLLVVLSAGLYYSSCEKNYEGLEIGYSAFEGDPETANAVTVQGEKLDNARLEVNVTIGLIPGEKINSIEFIVTFDPALIEFAGFDDLEYFGPEGSAKIGVNSQEENMGKIQFIITRSEGGAPPADGFGELVKLRFMAIDFINDRAQKGRCKDYTGDANFTYLHLRDPNLFDDRNQIITGVSWYGGVICIFDSSD